MRRAFCFSVLGLRRLSIHQALALGAAQQFGRAHVVGDPKRLAVRPAKIELGQVAVQMGFRDVVEGAG
jgi:hypothetical protein